MAAQRTGGVERCELFAPESLDLEQRHGEGVTERQRRGGAGSGRQRLGARLLRDACIEDDVGLTSEGRVRITRKGDDRHAEPLELTHEAEQLVGGAALREQDGDVISADEAQVAVQRVHRMEERGGAAGGGERSRDLARDQPRLADAGDDQPARGLLEQPHGGREGGARAQRVRWAPCGTSPRSKKYFVSRPCHSPRALRISSATSRTAPWPPGRVVTTRAAAFTSVTPFATAIGRPTRVSSGRSARSSPTKAHSSQASPRRSSSASNTGSLRAVGSWITSSTASSRARNIVAVDSRPESHTTRSPAVRSMRTPRPSWM